MDEWGPNLSTRTVGYKFPQVPDFLDPEYDRHNLDHQIRAGEQRYREHLVTVVEMRQLRENLRRCILRTGINSGRECHDLSAEYMKRIRCPGYICPDDERYEQDNFRKPITYSDYRGGHPDNSMERIWNNQKLPIYDDDNRG
jgi:hypothetical protein